MFTTLISVPDLQKNLGKKNWVLLDCRFTLGEPEQGRADYAAGHIPGALYAHLDSDLTGPIDLNEGGRHPLPDPDEFSARCAMWGIDDKSQVVVYDDAGGALAAARAWWLVKWLGHDAVAVLDGGYSAWVDAGGDSSTDVQEPEATDFAGSIDYKLMMEADDVLANLGDDTFPLFDSRGSDRYNGKNETIDPVSGHIPGAINTPYVGNLSKDGTFRPAEELKKRFEKYCVTGDAHDATFYCGSGVTACHNILACAHAGLGMARLYPGSWSDWITDENRPVQN